jgi:hypothetical protein
MHVKNQPKTAHIITPPEWWVMTYQGRLCQIKDTHDHEDNVHRYRRNGWTSQRVAETQAAKMNQMFHTQDFDTQQIQGAQNGTSKTA